MFLVVLILSHCLSRHPVDIWPIKMVLMFLENFNSSVKNYNEILGLELTMGWAWAWKRTRTPKLTDYWMWY